MLIHEQKFYQNPLKLPIAILQTDQCEFVSHWHYDLEFAFVLSGGMTVTLNGTPARLRAGDALVCAGGDIHSYQHPSANSRVVILMLDPIAARKSGALVLDTPTYSSLYHPGSPACAARLAAVLEEMYGEFVSLNDASPYFLYAYILETQGILHRYYTGKAALPSGQLPQAHLNTIRESISHIEEHYADAITIAGMAKAALMSVSNYSRAFKQITGTGFKEYVSLVRLREVTAAMADGKEGVAKIAYDCGFGSVRTFNRVFRAHYGMAPGAYCARLRGGA
jgi:AraC-like DNA-binding protein